MLSSSADRPFLTRWLCERERVLLRHYCCMHTPCLKVVIEVTANEVLPPQRPCDTTSNQQLGFILRIQTLSFHKFMQIIIQ